MQSKYMDQTLCKANGKCMEGSNLLQYIFSNVDFIFQSYETIFYKFRDYNQRRIQNVDILGIEVGICRE